MIILWTLIVFLLGFKLAERLDRQGLNELEKEFDSFCETMNKSLNARVKIENILWRISAGKRPVMTPEEHAEAAKILGIPGYKSELK